MREGGRERGRERERKREFSAKTKPQFCFNAKSCRPWEWGGGGGGGGGEGASVISLQLEPYHGCILWELYPSGQTQNTAKPHTAFYSSSRTPAAHESQYTHMQYVFTTTQLPGHEQVWQ